MDPLLIFWGSPDQRNNMDRSCTMRARFWFDIPKWCFPKMLRYILKQSKTAVSGTLNWCSKLLDSKFPTAPQGQSPPRGAPGTPKLRSTEPVRHVRWKDSKKLEKWGDLHGVSKRNQDNYGEPEWGHDWAAPFKKTTHLNMNPVPVVPSLTLRCSFQKCWLSSHVLLG